MADSSPDPNEKAVNPDLFVQRADGYWDVYDLKLPLLTRRGVTVGPRKRRRFIQTIEEGIAQLAHYKEFFDVQENRSATLSKYGVEFKDPAYGLIVGTYESVNAHRVREASRRLGRFEIIDYDSLLQLYLVGKGILPPTGGDPETRSGDTPIDDSE